MQLLPNYDYITTIKLKKIQRERVPLKLKVFDILKIFTETYSSGTLVNAIVLTVIFTVS